MRYRVPDYYKQFNCLAGECPNTCCAGWQIEIDEKSLIKYIKFKNKQHPFGSRLFNGVNWKEGVFLQDEEQRCEFLNEENLCDIYSGAGKRMLCKTCKTYPRHIEEFEDRREISLVLSCPEAARIILSKEDRVTFREMQKKRPKDHYEDFDAVLFAVLAKARDYLIDIAQERSVSLSDRMAKILLYGYDLQLCIRRGELKKYKGIERAHRKSGFGEHFQMLHAKAAPAEGSRYFLIQKVWELWLAELEVLKPVWPAYINKCMGALYSQGEEVYLAWRERFLETYKDWETECEQLLVYWIYTYFAGAAYDRNACTKLKFAVINTILILEMDIARYIEMDGAFVKPDQIKLCMDYSREIEHSDVNLERMEKLLGGSVLFDLVNLLTMI